MSSTEVATVEETRQVLLTRSRRHGAPIRKMFVQTPREIAPDVTNLAGPLARFVRNGDLRGLNALLFMIAITSSGASEDGWSTTLPVGVWARAFGTTISADGGIQLTGL